MSYQKVLFLPDIHCGDHDSRALQLALRVIQYWRPQRIIQLGDCLDFYGLSRFDKDPSAFAFQLQQELDVQHELYARISELAPRALKQQIVGNHEQRGITLAWKNPALSGLRALGLESLMQLDKLKWQPQTWDEISLAAGAFVVRHGSFVRRGGGASAKAELFATWRSGISGHTHRLCTYHHSADGGDFSWTEAGHLQANPPRWKSGVQDWHQGIVLGEFEEDGNAFNVTPVRFRHTYRCVIEGKEVSA